MRSSTSSRDTISSSVTSLVEARKLTWLGPSSIALWLHSASPQEHSEHAFEPEKEIQPTLSHVINPFHSNTQANYNDEQDKLKDKAMIQQVISDYTK